MKRKLVHKDCGPLDSHQLQKSDAPPKPIGLSSRKSIFSSSVFWHNCSQALIEIKNHIPRKLINFSIMKKIQNILTKIRIIGMCPHLIVSLKTLKVNVTIAC